MSGQVIKKSETFLFQGDTAAPHYLYYTSQESQTKSTPPTALFDPAGALSGTPFASSTSPRATPIPKKIVITLHTWQCASSAQLFALIALLHELKFKIYFWINGKAEIFPEDAPCMSIKEALTIFSRLTYFDPKTETLGLGGEPEHALCLDTKMSFKLFHDLDNYNAFCPRETDLLKYSTFSMGDEFPDLRWNNQELLTPEFQTKK